VPLALHNWWYEGGATWMASLVDDSIGVGIWELAQQELIDRRELSLVKGRYDAYSWWAYAADALGPDEMITLQVFMPDDVNDHAAYVADKLGDADAFMHEYALKLSNQDLAHGPFPDDLYTHYPITDLPSFALLSSETLGVGWTQLDIN